MLQDLRAHLSERVITLASQSPRRAQILTFLGLQFTQQPSSYEENLPKSRFATPSAYTQATARAKAQVVHTAQQTDGKRSADLILASDTVVTIDGSILEKPESEAHAVDMLRLLSGRSHVVVTAVCLLGDGFTREFAESTRVTFADLPDSVISAYVRGGEPMDKAGAYGIQGEGGAFVTAIDGCYFNVMGLPMHRVAAEIRSLVDDGLL